MKNGRFEGPFRQSLLKLYSQCPRKFKLLQVDQVEVEEEVPSKALSVGIWVHEILHDFHRTGKVNLKKKKYEIPEIAESEVHELVHAYIEHNKELEVVASEVEFAFNINSYQISGTIDLIYKDKDGRTVLRDIKTDSSTPSPEFLARDVQFSLYYLGAIRGLGIKPDLLEWYHTRHLVPYKRKTTRNGVQYQPGDPRGNPVKPVSRQMEDIPEIEREIRCVIQGIRFRIFPMRPLKWGHINFCQYCEVADYCIPPGKVVHQSTEFSDLEGFANYY